MEDPRKASKNKNEKIIFFDIFKLVLIQLLMKCDYNESQNNCLF